jgi:phage baseplate assembly protein V
MSAWERIHNMIARGVIRRVDSSRKMQALQIELLADEVQDGAEHFEPYGFTSAPIEGAECVAIFPAGIRSHALVIVAADRRYRLTMLAAGEVALHDDQGQIVHLKRDGIAITSPFKVELTAPTVTVSATSATITADTVNLGAEGGPAVARVGDPVVGGHIQSGSGKVFAA